MKLICFSAVVMKLLFLPAITWAVLCAGEMLSLLAGGIFPLESGRRATAERKTRKQRALDYRCVFRDAVFIKA